MKHPFLKAVTYFVPFFAGTMWAALAFLSPETFARILLFLVAAGTITRMSKTETIKLYKTLLRIYKK